MPAGQQSQDQKERERLARSNSASAAPVSEVQRPKAGFIRSFFDNLTSQQSSPKISNDAKVQEFSETAKLVLKMEDHHIPLHDVL